MIGTQTLAINYYCKIFMPIESKLAILTNERKYKRLEDILKILIYIFDDKKFDDKKLGAFLSNVYQYQSEYYCKLCELKKPSEEQIKKHTGLSQYKVSERVIKFNNLLIELDQTTCDIYKVIVVLLIRNNKLDDKFKLLEVRQYEI